MYVFTAHSTRDDAQLPVSSNTEEKSRLKVDVQWKESFAIEAFW